MFLPKKAMKPLVAVGLCASLTCGGAATALGSPATTDTAANPTASTLEKPSNPVETQDDWDNVLNFFDTENQCLTHKDILEAANPTWGKLRCIYKPLEAQPWWLVRNG